jgi:hypothetical protein
MRLSYDLSFLKARIPNFAHFLANGGQAFVPGVTEEQVAQLVNQLESDHTNIRLSFVRNVLYIKKPTGPHEAPSHVFGSSIHDLNVAISGNGLFPIMNTLSSRQYLYGGINFYEADCSAKVERIGHQSANIVLETRFRNLTENYEEFFDHLRSFLLDTEDVMVVIGIIILEPYAPAMAPMVCVVYDRDRFLNNATFHQPSRLISFGAIPLHGNSRNAIELAAGPFGVRFPMVGVGISPIPENVLNVGNANNAMYVIEIEANFLLRRDNVGNELVADPPVDHMGFPIQFRMRLYDIRYFVLLRMSEL